MDPMLFEAAISLNSDSNYQIQDNEITPNQNSSSILMDPKLYEAAMNGDLNFLQNMTMTSQITACQETVLHVATEFHQTEFVKSVVVNCPLLVLQANSFGDTALHIAAREMFSDIVEFLIARTADVEAGQHREFLRMVNFDGDTALHCAARIGSYASVKLLVEADPDLCGFVNNANESSLYLSVASKSWDVPELITKASSPLASHTGANGLTALHLAVIFLKYPLERIELLVKWRRQMIREGDHLGLTPLHYAAFYGRSDAIKLFIQSDNSAIQVLDSHGESALHLAAIRGHVKALQELINCRPDSYNLTDNKGRTILHAAVLGNRRKVVEFILETPRLAKLINKQDKYGNTPVHLAALFKLYAVIGILAKNKNVSLIIMNKNFMTPADVFNKHDEIGFKASVVHSLLKNTVGRITKQQFVGAQVKKMNKLEPMIATSNNLETTTTENNVKEENSDLYLQNTLEVNLLVATLVATVTFTGGFTMPGGYNNDEPDEGLATLTSIAAFQVFVVFNTLAFFWSVLAVVLQLHTSLDKFNRLRYMGIAVGCTNMAILGMVLAYSSGTYIVLTQSITLSIIPYLICGCFTLLFFAIFLVDPGVVGFPCVTRLQDYLRDKIIRCVGQGW